MTTRPRIHCPHCDAIFEAQQIGANRKYRNKYGIDVFACAECLKLIKIEPREYMFASHRLKTGEFPEGCAIGAVPEDDILPSEQAAIDFARADATKSGCLPVVAVIGVGISVLLNIVW
jgi:hypothetical protein